MQSRAVLLFIEMVAGERVDDLSVIVIHMIGTAHTEAERELICIRPLNLMKRSPAACSAFLFFLHYFHFCVGQLCH